MAWDRDRRLGSRSACALRRSHWFSYLVIHGPKLRLKEAAAQAIGLALHELATNAGKYGALSTATGRVDVRWGTEGDAFSVA
jgi:two-component sensor histidine kinase